MARSAARQDLALVAEMDDPADRSPDLLGRILRCRAALEGLLPTDIAGNCFTGMALGNAYAVRGATPTFHLPATDPAGGAIRKDATRVVSAER